MPDQLQPTAFRGDADADELHAFFLPDRQFDGDTRWSFGTSLKAMYVNTYEFMNHAPVTQLWRDTNNVVQAVSRLSLGTGDWFHLAAPAYRIAEVTTALVHQADAAFTLLTNHSEWSTVRYASHGADIGLLERLGYEQTGTVEVYMEQSLARPFDPAPIAESVPDGVEVRLLNTADSAEMLERAMAQVDAFSEAEPTDLEARWIERSLPHQLHYGSPHEEPHVIAIDRDGTVLAVADVFLDRTNLIGEFEPVATRKRAQRSGLGKAVLTRGLNEMHAQGMGHAVVRTGADNVAAIAAYESVGFEVTDHLVQLRKERTS